ncbi:hypothetical protein EI77_01386 [Prosthecobacter fusiformis]|uniref:Heavy-metal-associated domain-containing protein n=1 Tax=Prosthecobacter fusiformis TaxID=48464 RepID=A0A4R7S3F6_9BACT|nr:hypothetical protein [Prosthecobacter fusiformis]TDU72920.1 hypothetical protein EI77_01386 [Prosthecobacter fusiformis]
MMIEIEVYAPGLRAESRLLELRGQMDLIPQVRYKVDTHHELVYFELDEPTEVSMKDVMEVFTNIGLQPRLVGQVPEELV